MFVYCVFVAINMSVGLLRRIVQKIVLVASVGTVIRGYIQMIDLGVVIYVSNKVFIHISRMFDRY